MRALSLWPFVLHVAGCTTMRPLEGPYAATLPASGAGRVQVTTTTGDRLTIAEPRIGDDVISCELLDQRNQRTDIRWSSPLAQVQAIGVAETNTVLTVLGIGAGLLVGLMVIWLAGEPG